MWCANVYLHIYKNLFCEQMQKVIFVREWVFTTTNLNVYRGLYISMARFETGFEFTGPCMSRGTLTCELDSALLLACITVYLVIFGHYIDSATISWGAVRSSIWLRLARTLSWYRWSIITIWLSHVCDGQSEAWESYASRVHTCTCIYHIPYFLRPMNKLATCIRAYMHWRIYLYRWYTGYIYILV